MPRIIADAQLRTSGFEQGLQRMERLGKEASGKLSKSFSGLLVGGVFAAGLGQVASQLDRVAKLSARFNVPTDDLQRLGFAAEQSGADLETVARGLNQLSKNLQMADSSRELRDAFEALNLDFRELQELSPWAAFLRLSDAVAAADTPSQGLAETLQILGRSGAELVPLLQEGSDAIRKLGEEIEPVSEANVKAIERFDDATNKVKVAFQTSVGTALGGVIRLVEGLSEGIGLLTVRFGELFSQLKSGASFKEAAQAAERLTRATREAINATEEARQETAITPLRPTFEAAPSQGYQGPIRETEEEQRARLRGGWRGRLNGSATAMLAGLPQAVATGIATALTAAEALRAEQGKEVRLQEAGDAADALRDVLSQLRQVSTEELGQFRSIGSNERNPYVEQQIRLQQDMAEKLRAMEQHLRTLAQRNMAEELAAQFAE